MRHLQETELALYATGELPRGWAKLRTGLHVRNCADCRERVTAYRLDQVLLREELHGEELPEGVNWERLSREMTANIHLGLAAGECVAPAQAERPGLLDGMMTGWNWRPAAGVAGLALVLWTASWLNLPASDLTVLGKALDRALHGQAGQVVEQAPMVAASPDGIEYRGIGETRLSLSSGNARTGMVQASFDGSTSERWVDDTEGVNHVTVSFK